jgi:hypothetical protein
MSAVRVILGISFFLFAGCSVLSVSEGPNKVPGIPFYAKKTVHDQKTSWREDRFGLKVVERIYLVDASTPSGDRRTVLRETVLFEKPIWADSLATNEMQNFRSAVIANQANSEIIIAADAVATLNRSRVCTGPDRNIRVDEPGCFTLLANRIISTVIVDSATVYYLNARHPLMGKGTLGFELGPDQTITKAAATVEDSTLQTVLDLLPIHEYLTAKHLPTPVEGESKALEPQVHTEKEVIIMLTPVGLIHHFQKPMSTGKVGLPLASIEGGVEYWVETPIADGEKAATPVTLEGTFRIDAAPKN